MTLIKLRNSSLVHCSLMGMEKKDSRSSQTKEQCSCSLFNKKKGG
uniref:Uncharacterized protein n=1 Tax=Arundo donax TaxID=35708 RepID=A0A0A9DSK2_ARUDO